MLINVEEIIELEIHLGNTTVITVTKDTKTSEGKFDQEQDVYKDSRYFPHKVLINSEGENNTFMECGIYPLNQVIKANITSTRLSHASWGDALTRTQGTYAIPSKNAWAESSEEILGKSKLRDVLQNINGLYLSKMSQS